ncbi:cupin domain-containing protein [Nonomuraea lactucae]|uniref:cupin domain-containing protein n=1 Tax=Nonomuraea lactucae TaxID=2249762 RepID=UPI000DE389FE|nr:cupin domain-containing protein [Nonomuraea lactucae]
MPVISGADAPTFALPHVTATGLAAPSRGATETCAWRFAIAPGMPADSHAVDREEIFVVLSGSLTAIIEGEEHALSAGDALIVPAHTPFGIGNPHDEPAELVAVLPVGGRAIMPGMAPFTPPWAE